MKNATSNFKLSEKNTLIRNALISIVIAIMVLTTFFNQLHYGWVPLLYLVAWLLLVYVEQKKANVMVYSSILSGVTLFYIILRLLMNASSGSPLIWLYIFFLPPPLNLWSLVLAPFEGLTDFRRGIDFVQAFLLISVAVWFIMSIFFYRKSRTPRNKARENM